MATIQADLLIFYSGAKESGGYSNSPLESLGGFPSTVKIPNLTEDALFDEIGILEASRGQVDYRCIFLKNNSAVDTLRDLTLVVTDPNGALTKFGSIHAGVEIPDDADSPVQMLGSMFEEPRNIEWAETDEDGVELSNTLAPGALIAVWLRRTVNAITERNLNAKLTFTFTWT